MPADFSGIDIGDATQPARFLGGIVLPKDSGTSYFVNSATGNTNNDGLSWSTAKATLGQVLALSGLAAGDTVYIASGHAETLTAVVTASDAGITILGIGAGTRRPTFTVNGTVDALSLEAANIVVENLRFATPTLVATAQINIAAANCQVRKCRFEQGLNSRDAITITAAGELPVIEDNEFIVSADGPDSGIIVEGVIDRPIIRQNVFVGSGTLVGVAFTDQYDVGCINFSGQAVTNPVVYGNQFLGGDDATPLVAIANAGSLIGDSIGPNVYAGLATSADTMGMTLADDAITAAKIAANAIGASEIANAAIDAATFAAGAIDAAAIAAGAIDAATFAAGAIDAAAIAAGAIDADALAADAVAEIADGVADEVLSGHVTAGTVGASLAISASGTAQAGGAANQIILAATDAAVDDTYIGQNIHIIAGTGAGQIAVCTDYATATKIATIAPNWATAPNATSVYVVRPNGFAHVEALAADVITAASIANGAIDAATFAAGAIDAAAIGVGAIAADAFAAGAIDAAAIGVGAIAADAFAAGAIDAAAIAAGAIDAATFAAGAIDAAAIAAGAIDAATFAAGAIDAAAIGVGAIAADAFAAGAIDAAAIANGAIDAATFAAGAIDAAAIAAGAIDAATFAAGAIDAAAIANAAIDAATFAAGAIDAAAIGVGAIAADAFAAGAIDAAAIANGAIDAATFAAGAIDAAAIADNAIDVGALALSAGEKTCDGVVITRSTAALPQTANAPIFTVTGLCVLKRIVGYVTIAVGAVANATKLTMVSTGAGANTDLCGILDINGHVADRRYEITGVFANAMVSTLDLPLAQVQTVDVVVVPGTINLDCAGSDGGGGRVRWSATYVPLETGAQIVAA